MTLTQEEIENLNGLIITKWVELIFTQTSYKEKFNPYDFTDQFQIPNVYRGVSNSPPQTFKQQKRREHFSIHPMRPVVFDTKNRKIHPKVGGNN